ncbi:MAG: hypothetical protein DA328_05680 [Nitrososphaeraceae archaeon]|nr:hypothetical protein [Nitrososphaeraceae archaeon]
MDNNEYKINEILDNFIQNSTITKRQLSIIYNKLNMHGPMKNISSGAYYRQIKQCREKTKGILYSIILLNLYGAIDKDTISVLKKTVEQIEDVVVTNNEKKLSQENIMNVISLIEQIVDKCVTI